MKPSNASESDFRSSNNPAPSVQSAQMKTSQSADVPVAQFDWNSSGLVNPLDGMHKYNNVSINKPKKIYLRSFHDNDNT